MVAISHVLATVMNLCRVIIMQRLYMLRSSKMIGRPDRTVESQHRALEAIVKSSIVG
jgi:hypothetical protein